LAPTVKAADVQPALVFPSWEGAVALAPVVVPGGIGGHKWSDRRLLDQAQADCGDAVPVVLDDDRGVLEISRGNVFVASGGALLTPPADGRLLPGVARRRVIEAAAEAGIEVREQAIAEDELVAADEVFVTGSVRGVEPVRAYADVRRWDEGRLTPLVSAALRRRWLPDGDPDYTRPT
jgi:para-aminobenzoate synthetase/4-amino-4-deoxychorismate lyase